MNIQETMKELAQYLIMQEEISETVEGLKDQIKAYMKENSLETLASDEHKATYKTVKEWIEEFVVRHTVNTVLTDDNIELIATKAAELMEKEFAESSVLATLEQTKKDIDRRIKNMIDLMEQGIVTPSTRERLLELESQKTDLEQRMARETMKKLPLSKERILHWLYSFKGGNINDMEYRQRVIDTLVNSIYVYDNDGGNSRKIVFTFNISGQNTSVVNCSDIACFAPPYLRNLNIIPIGDGFGFLLFLSSIVV